MTTNFRQSVASALLALLVSVTLIGGSIATESVATQGRAISA